MDGDLLSTLDPPPADVVIFCAEQAEAIRVLGRRVVADIIEIGQRLIAVKDHLSHGGWLPWLDNEFGWNERSARRFIAVAEAFGKTDTVSDLPIDASALYLLSGPSVPQTVRDEAIEQAEAGDRITKADAEKLVAAETKKAIDQALSAWTTQQESVIEVEISKATNKLADDKKTLQAEIDRIDKFYRKPDVAELCRAIQRNLGTTTLSKDQYRLIARVLGQAIIVGREHYDPAPPDKLIENEEHLRISSKITEALEILAGAPTPEAVLAATWPVQRNQHRRVISTIINWLDHYQAVLGYEEETNV